MKKSLVVSLFALSFVTVSLVSCNNKEEKDCCKEKKEAAKVEETSEATVIDTDVDNTEVKDTDVVETPVEEVEH